jgi:hypothetical protein
MKYADGTVARVGDRVRIWDVDTGVIVASMDTGEYSAEYPEAEWGNLKTGVMVLTDKGARVHVEEDPEEPHVLARMPLHDNEISSLAKAWIEHHLHSKGAVNEATFWAWQRLYELIQSEPEKAWKVIEAIRQANGSDWNLGNLGAGPLEDLLAEHGDEFIDRIESLARQDAQFRKLLGAVWRNTISEKVWSRIRAVAGPSF